MFLRTSARRRIIPALEYRICADTLCGRHRGTPRHLVAKTSPRLGLDRDAWLASLAKRG
jgi:hypothetical protein